MDKKNKSVFDRYAEEIRSGATSYTATKEPELHPDSLFVDKSENPVDKTEPVSFLDRHKNKLLILSAVLWFALSGVILWFLLTNKKDVELPQEAAISEILRDISLDSIEVESEPSYVAEQNLALEQLRAWERLSREIIERYFSEPIQPGYKRTLCITLDGKRNCKTMQGSDAAIQGIN